MEKSDYRGLNNQQIVFLYLVNLSTIKKYTSVVEKGGYLVPADLPGLGRVTIFKEVTLETIERIRTSPTLIQAQGIYDVLHPVVELIKELSPQEYAEAETVFNYQIQL